MDQVSPTPRQSFICCSSGSVKSGTFGDTLSPRVSEKQQKTENLRKTPKSQNPLTSINTIQGLIAGEKTVRGLGTNVPDVPKCPQQMTLADLKKWLGRRSQRTATSGRCRTCRALVVQGLDADQCALPTTADPTPLTAIGETLALLDGLRTFTATRTNGGSVKLTGRNKFTADPRTAFDVYASHECGHIHTHIAVTRIAPFLDQVGVNDACPF